MSRIGGPAVALARSIGWTTYTAFVRGDTLMAESEEELEEPLDESKRGE